MDTIPCKDCIVLSRCKSRVENIKAVNNKVKNLVRTCSLLKDYIFSHPESKIINSQVGEVYIKIKWKFHPVTYEFIEAFKIEKEKLIIIDPISLETRLCMVWE